MKLSIAGKALHRYPEDWRETGSDWVDIVEDFPQYLEKQRQEAARKALGLTMRQMGELNEAARQARAELAKVEAAQERGEEYEPADIDMPDIPVERQLEKDDAVAAFDIKHYLKSWGSVDEAGNETPYRDDNGHPVACNDETKRHMTEPIFWEVARIIEQHRSAKQPGEAEVKNSSESSGNTSGELISPDASAPEEIPQN